MKRSLIVLSALAVLALAGCSHGTSWTPMAAGRTAGKSTVATPTATAHKADKTFSKALRK